MLAIPLAEVFVSVIMDVSKWTDIVFLKERY